MARSSNDLVVTQHRLAMKERAAACAKFIATRRRKLTVEQLERVIFAAWQGAPAKSVH